MAGKRKILEASNNGNVLRKAAKTSPSSTIGNATRNLPTLSVAVPGSIIENAQTTELATAMAGQIARTAAIFNVDEVVVIDDSNSGGKLGKGAAFLARILQHLETPQYLRKALIPMHNDLRLAGVLPPLDAPHHMRANEWCQYREGVVVKSAAGLGSVVNVGLDEDAYIEQAVRSGARITLEMGESAEHISNSKVWEGQGRMYSARLAKMTDPRQKLGLYWGYQTRIAGSLEELTSNCPFKGGYDFKVGTSEHGSKASACELTLPRFQHLLLVFGGPLGLEDCFAKDGSVTSKDPRNAFDMYINTCPNQGSRTIRSEEAILISLSYLQPSLAANSAIV